MYWRKFVRSERDGLDLQVDAHNLVVDSFLSQPGQLAKLGEAHMRGGTQFQPRRNQDAVDLETGGSFEFKEDIDQASVAGAATQDPTATAENRTGEGFDEPGRLFT